MTGHDLRTLIKAAPLPGEARLAAIARERLFEAAGAADPGLAARLQVLLNGPAGALVDSVFTHSPFLTRLVCRDPSGFAADLASPPGERLAELLSATRNCWRVATDEADLMARLRDARARAALLVALCDVGGLWSLGEVTAALTRFADAAVGAAIDWLLQASARAGDLQLTDEVNPSAASGLIVLGMGKYGAGELNYSSDIDLIVYYDRSVVRLTPGREPAPVFIRLVQGLVRLLQTRSADGYVFRVDLRLRPDGNASPVAMSTETAELYYEASGQNWERAAMIKARAVAGDLAAGAGFLEGLEPFIWRRYLDYAAIEDIHSIKRQIHAHKGHGRIAIAGHNLKLGRGGIREIEFFAQTQQLILGGRKPAFRQTATCAALERFAADGVIAETVRADLIAAYDFLRTVEHRLQMVNDEQTHTLPRDAAGLEAIARFSGFADTSSFEAVLRAHLTRVEEHYRALFESSETLAAEGGNLVFTGVENDPETIRTLTNMGFARAGDVSGAIRGWHHGHIAATRSARAREILTRLVPPLLKTLSGAPDADEAFFRFARFLEGLPAGVQIFSLLQSNVWLLEVLCDAFGLAPRLARILAEAPSSLDALIEPDSLTHPVSLDDLGARLGTALARSAGLENKLDAARVFAREARLKVSLQLLRGTIDARTAGEGFSAIADVAVAALARVAEDEMAARHGRIAGANWAVVALGKLGSRELTATSDLDLVFVYDFDETQADSSGPQPLHAIQYFARLSQKLISLLTAPTSEGKLYDVDMRLRPSGVAGPVAVTLDRFAAYHREQAWVYEHMALTRARIVHASDGFGKAMRSAIDAILRLHRDPRKTVQEAHAMRLRLDDTKREKDLWHLKHVRGGIVDLEFIAQTLMLIAASDVPEVLSPSTRDTLARLVDARRLGAEEGARLVAAFDLYQTIAQVLRIALGEETAPGEGASPLARRLAAMCGETSFETLEVRLAATQAEVLAIFEGTLGALAAA